VIVLYPENDSSLLQINEIILVATEINKQYKVRAKKSVILMYNASILLKQLEMTIQKV